MDKIKLLAILPYEGLHKLIMEIAADYPHIELDCYIGDMEDGLKIAQSIESEAYFAILSRAGTADLIAKHVSLPVIDIKITVSDMMRAIRLAQGFSGKFAIVGFPTIISYANAVADMFQSQLNIFTVHHQSQIDPCLERLKHENYSLIVGDVITTNHAKKHGYNVILITSSAEGVKLTLDEAVNWHKNFHKLQNKKNLYKKIFDYTTTAIMAYDADEILVYTNAVVQNDLSLFTENLRPYLHAVIEKEAVYFLKKIGSTVWNITGKKIQLEEQRILVFYGQICTNVHKISKAAFQYDSEKIPTLNFSTFQSSTPSLQNLIYMAKNYGKTALPILIIGEKGTGKQSLAYMIYQDSTLCNNTFVTVDCQWMNPKSWQILLDGQDSPFTRSGVTIYFKHLHFLDHADQSLLENYLYSTAIYKRNRLIFSYFPGANEAFDKGQLLYYISNNLGALTLHVPSLNERREDIPYMAALYLNEFNTSLGKQIMGLQPEALSMMQAFNWRDNIDQFKRTMRQLVILTGGAYISFDIVSQVLRTENGGATSKGSPVNLHGTLDDITRDVIRTVLEEEAMNQSQAAKRLGISRSTLWRKMDKYP